ncbi:MAG: ABC transporter permease [Thermoanaerobaculia bacterium]|nr:ABC transporter permease [Thermoanaerobaculia bacterium]
MLQDLRLTLRRLCRSPVWTLAVVSVLAVGLGLGTTIFAVADSLIFETPAVADPHRLLSVFAGGGSGSSGVTDYEPMAYPDVRDLRNADSFEEVTAYAPTTVTVETGDEGFGAVAEAVERNYFRILGVTPAEGRFFTSGDKGDGACDVVVLSRGLQQRLGVAAGGEQPGLRVNGLPVRPVGVAPKSFRGLMRGLEPDLWLPMDCVRELRFDQARNVRLGRASPGLDRFEDRGVRWVWAVGRLHDGISQEQARSEVSALGARLAREHPDTNRGRRFLVSSNADLRLAPDLDRRLREAAAAALTIASCVLLVACGNVAALLVLRSQGRRREMAARSALGAGTMGILRLLWLEGAVLATLGVVGALAIAALTSFALGWLDVPVPIPVALVAEVDSGTLLVAIGAALSASLVFVAAPALEHWRTNLASTLRTGAAATSTRPHHLLAVSVILQTAVSLALWTTAATAGQSLFQARQIDPGCRPEGVVTARFDSALQGFSASERSDVHERLITAASRLPGVGGVSYASHLPLSMELLLSRVATKPSEVERHMLPADRADVDEGYFETLGVELLAGRGFTSEEREESLPVAVVNLAMARSLWHVEQPGEALGRQLWQHGQEQALRVVGVARTGKYRSLSEEDRAFFYRPLRRDAAGARILIVRFTSLTSSRESELGTVLGNVEPRLIADPIETAKNAMAASLFVPNIASTLLTLFGTLALLLTAAGLYGVFGHSVVQHRREIGIRMAVGGSPACVALEALGPRVLQVLLGVPLGLTAGLLLSNRLTFLIHYDAWQLRSMITAAGVVLTVACLAGIRPARRAARTDPAHVLRSD